MVGVLDVWVSKPGDPCSVDDQPWIVYIYNCCGHIYQWADTRYAELPAPKGHWSGTIPPGCYIVRAFRKDIQAEPWSSPSFASHAGIVTVGCEGVICIRLYAPELSPEKDCCKKDVDELRHMEKDLEEREERLKEYVQKVEDKENKLQAMKKELEERENKKLEENHDEIQSLKEELHKREEELDTAKKRLSELKSKEVERQV